jgi:CDP-glycerol glycerophosphotransferase
MDLRARFGLPANDRIVLFAPTWAQDERGRNIYPFGASENEFLEALSATASRNGAKIVLRAHLNSKSALSRVHEAVLAIPQGEYPDTEGLLLVSDVLICDWSSIAFDYLLLKRPTIFLDVPAPFRKSFSLGPEYRFGLIVTDLEELVERLEACLRDPSSYLADARDRHEKAIRDVYDGFADGHSGERCAERLLHHLTTDESFQ